MGGLGRFKKLPNFSIKNVRFFFPFIVFTNPRAETYTKIFSDMKRTCSLMSRVGLVRLKGGEDIFKVQTAARAIEKRLYVSIPVLENESLASLQKRLGDVYHAAFASDPHVDTMVLLRGTNPPDVTVFLGYQEEEAEANQLNVPHHVLAPRESGCAPLSEATGDADLKQYTSMCMGGTFDRLHVGQKLLLSSAAHCMKPGGRLFCGIAGDALFKEKALRELIQPYGRRERVVRQFFSTIRPDVCYETAELTDGYGPSIVEPSIEAIIVTEETASGGAKCNEVRAEKGFPAMDVVTIGLISASGELTANLPTTAKLSSTGQRQAKIGGLFHDPRFFCKRNTNKAYTICVTGGIATGKSTVSQILAKQDDVEMINADQLGHLAYEIGSESNRKIKETFSPLNPAVAAEDGSIDRKVLGSLVFGEDKTNMTKLTDIVWPAIRTMITTKIAESTARVLVVEAAVAKEAGWEDMFDEVWLCVIPPAVAKARLMERNSLSAEDAEKRIASQLTGPERMTTAHVLLSNHKDVAALSEDTLLAYKDVLSRTSTTLSSLDGIAATWSQLAADAGLTPESTAYWWREVRDRYAQTGRDYHTLSHLEEVCCEGSPPVYSLTLGRFFFAEILKKERQKKSAQIYCNFLNFTIPPHRCSPSLKRFPTRLYAKTLSLGRSSFTMSSTTHGLGLMRWILLRCGGFLHRQTGQASHRETKTLWRCGLRRPQTMWRRRRRGIWRTSWTLILPFSGRTPHVTANTRSKSASNTTT